MRCSVVTLWRIIGIYNRSIKINSVYFNMYKLTFFIVLVNDHTLKSSTNLTDSVCINRTLGDQEETWRTDGTFLALRMTAVEAAVLVRIAVPAA